MQLQHNFTGGSEGHWRIFEKVSKRSADVILGCTADKSQYSNLEYTELGTKRKICFAANPLQERIIYTGSQTAVVVPWRYVEQFSTPHPIKVPEDEAEYS